MRILFVMRHSGYVRNWDWVLRELARRGHRVHLGFELYRDQAIVAESIRQDTNGAVTYGYVPLRNDFWRPLVYGLRQGIDYLRYLTPEYRDATKLRARAKNGTPGLLILLTKLPLIRSQRGIRFLDRVLRACERAVPPLREITDFIAEFEADVVMATPLVAGHSQHDYIAAAQSLGRMTVLPVNSWDNLTNKGVVHIVPERVYLWNEAQRREAVEFHGMPRDIVSVVGAHTFDHWFGWKPSTTRHEFCASRGLDPEKPFLLYVCSSGFITPDERPYVVQWMKALRESEDPVLRDIGILVRPHPSPGRVWLENPLDGVPGAVVWPPIGSDPRTDEAKRGYFDSMYHASAVVGVNTSAFIEAAIVGRRTYTILFPELQGTQEGTLHFHYLLSENGGPLTVATSPDEHARQVAAALSDPAAGAWNEPFLKTFVRPCGLDRDAAPILVDDLEAAVRAHAPVPVSAPSLVKRALLFLPAVAMQALVPRGFGIRRRARALLGTDPDFKRSSRTRFQRGFRRAMRRARRQLLFGLVLAARPMLPSAAREWLKARLRGRLWLLPAPPAADRVEEPDADREVALSAGRGNHPG